tara:strand:+ start:1176 stop:2390 length:1215 start_codon:yes stop_codon:yes gene_type:complete
MRNLLILILFISNFLLGQNPCGTDGYNKFYIDSNPKSYKNIENQLQDYLKITPKSTTNITIPVVFHVVWINNIQNLHDSVIYHQLEVLNSIFNSQNPDTVNLTDTLKRWVGDFNINFEIAHRDPNGFPTRGITRKKTFHPHFSYWNNPVKKLPYGVLPWPTDRYLNIWICDLNDGLNGYAQFPGGPEETDGIVVDWQTVGNQIYPWVSFENYEWAKGKVLVHEIGHWLNLYHPWGNDGSCTEDYIPETSFQNSPIFPHNNCPDTMFSSCSDSGRIFIKHYMDYSGSSCMCTFTKNQVLRGLASLNTYRIKMVENYLPKPIINGFENTKIYPTYVQDIIYIEFPIYEGIIEILIYNLQGRLMKQLITQNNHFETLNLSDLVNGIYVVNLLHNGKSVVNKKIIINN